MRLVTNSVAPNQVRETETEWIIEDVPFVRPMELSGGYVPRENIKRTANQWNGVPPTLNHPRDSSGEPIAANMAPETHLGITKNARFDGEFVRGDIHINKDRIQQIGGEAHDIERALENGEQINVSSQYAAEDVEPGEYDGEYRANVERIIRPDSIAILPNKPAQCSVEDGCGINPQMVANSALSIPMRPNAKHYEVGELVTWPFGDGTGRGKVAEVFTESGEVSRTIEGTEVTREVTDDEAAYLLDVWRDSEGEFSGQALKSGSELSAWSDPPADVTDDGETPEGMAANMIANQAMALTDVTPDDVDSYTDSEWDGSAATAAMPNPSESDDAASALDAAHLLHPTDDDERDDKSNWKLPFREGPDAAVNTRALVAARAAISGARGGVDAPEDDLEGADARAVDFLVDAPEDLFGSMDSEDSDMDAGSMHMEDNTAESIGKKVLTMLGLASDEPTANEPAESGAETQETMDREKLISDITANSPLTEASLSERCDDGLEAIHSDVMDAADEDTQTANEDTEPVREITEDELEELVANKAEEIIDEREQKSQQEELATEIVANSAEYESVDAVLDDYPTEKALKTKKDSLTPSASLPGRGASTTANSEPTDDFPTMEIGGDD